MKLFWILLTGVGLCWSICAASSLHADETRLATRPMVAPNAAGIYWLAFAAMPVLTDEQKKAVQTANAADTAPLTEDLQAIVALHPIALHELHRARTVTPCDWQLDFAAGPILHLPHLSKARDLSRVALLRARQRFEAGETDAAVSDVLAVFKMARDCGASPLLICYLVQVAVEKSATEVLAAHLPSLGREQLGQIETALKELPAPCDMASSLHGEERIFIDWLEREVNAAAAKLNDPQSGGRLLMAISEKIGNDNDRTFQPQPNDADGIRKAALLMSLSVADVRESLQKIRADYAELRKIAALPYEERADHIGKFEETLAAASHPKTREAALRYFSATFLPAIRNVLIREEQADARRQLLAQAIRVQRDGVDALQPIHGKKVEYQKTPTGFELRCPCSSGVEVLKVGSAS